MKKPHWHLDPDEHIVTAWAEAASGPGWSNRPIWVLVCRNGTNTMRVECLQPGQQSPEMHMLYNTANAVHSAMSAHVNALMHAKLIAKRGALPLAEAQRLRVCRVCRKRDVDGPGLPFVYDYGKEYAHEACIKKGRKR